MKFAYLIEPPFNYRDAAGKVTGCDVELARHVFDELDENFEPVEAEFAELLPGLAQGRWQMTTGLFTTEQRRQHVLFSRAIWALPDGLLVAKGNPAGITGYASLAERKLRVAVIRNQVQYDTAVASGLPSDNILVFDTYEAAAHAVIDGRADAYASVARAHVGYLALNPELRVEAVTVPASEQTPAEGAFGFSHGNDIFRRAVDGALTTYIGSRQHRSMMRRFGFSDAEMDLLL